MAIERVHLGLLQSRYFPCWQYEVVTQCSSVHVVRTGLLPVDSRHPLLRSRIMLHKMRKRMTIVPIASRKQQTWSSMWAFIRHIRVRDCLGGVPDSKLPIWVSAEKLHAQIGSGHYH